MFVHAVARVQLVQGLKVEHIGGNGHVPLVSLCRDLPLLPLIIVVVVDVEVEWELCPEGSGREEAATPETPTHSRRFSLDVVSKCKDVSGVQQKQLPDVVVVVDAPVRLFGASLNVSDVEAAIHVVSIRIFRDDSAAPHLVYRVRAGRH